MIEKYLTTEQVSNILQVHPFTILKFLRVGKLKGIKLGRVYRIKESDVHEFLGNMSINSKETKPETSKAKVFEDDKEPAKENPSPAKSETFEIKEPEGKSDGEHYYII